MDVERIADAKARRHQKDAQVSGIQTNEIVRIVTIEPVGDNAITVYFKDSQGRLGEQMLFRSDEPRLELAQAGKPWAFDAPGLISNLLSKPGASS